MLQKKWGELLSLLITLCTLLLHLTLLLKETFYSHFQLFWITARIGWHALMLKNAHGLILSSASALYPVCLKHCVLAPDNLRPTS